MTAAQRKVWMLARARVSLLQPQVAMAVLRSFGLIVAALPEAQVAQLIRDGLMDRILTQLLAEQVLTRATMPVRLALRDVVQRSFKLNVPYLPNAGKVDGTLAVVFDQLNPRVLEAMRTLETRVVSGMHESVRETVRQTLARGLENRQAPATTAREIRATVGLSPRAETAVANFRAMLEAGDREALSRLLRDRRFDQTLERALGADGKGLSADQIDRMVSAYRKRSIAREAETISRTATQDAYKTATRESWRSAVERGLVDGDRLKKQWIGVNDDRERPEHLAMNDEVAPFDAPYSSGQLYAGAGDFNCRCIDRYFVGRA